MRSRVVLHQRREPPPDAEVDARLQVGGVGPVHVVALFAGHHLERELVVVAQEDRPLAGGRDVGRLLQDLDQRMAVFLRDRHVHARHQREVERHVAFVAVAEVRRARPRATCWPRRAAACSGSAASISARICFSTTCVSGRFSLRGAFALDQVRDRVQAEAVDPHVEPELHGAEHRLQHARVVEVEVGLVAEEAVPVVLLGHRVPGPVRLLGVGEDDARALVLLVGVAPHVPVALARAGRRAPRGLEPRVLVGGVVHHQLGDHPQAAPLRLAHEHLEVLAPCRTAGARCGSRRRRSRRP